MARFFKKEENKPLTYSSIVERKAGPNYAVWIMGGIVFIAISLPPYFNFK